MKEYTIKEIENTKDVAILAKVAKRGDYFSFFAIKNPNCPPKTIAKVIKKTLRKRKENYILWLAIRHPNCPSEVLRKFVKEKSLWSCYAIKHPNCPSEILDEIINKDENNLNSWNAVSNVNCPSELLIKVLRRGKNDDVSRIASIHSSCPPKVFVEWLEATGQLTKYDPLNKNHELEKIPEDKDLEELRKLL